MPQQTDSAVPTRLACVESNLIGHKLRLAGRLLSYDAPTALILLLDGDKAVLVDVSLCVDPKYSLWARERLGVIMTIGHLEEAQVQLPIPVIPAHAPAPEINPHLVLRALLVVQASDLDMDLWNAAIKKQEAVV